MQNSEDSTSLVIAQGKNELDLNSISENNHKEQDLFELSRDDPTLSFQIQQEKKQIFPIFINEDINHLPKNQQTNQPKRKRKDIFEKFKKSTINQSVNSQDNLLNIFDSIFKTKTQSQANQLRNTEINNNFLRPTNEVIERSKTPSAQKRQRLKIFGKKNKQMEYQGILPSELIESQVQPPNNQISSPIIKKKTSDSINLSLIENRFSRISAEENVDYSREEQQIQNILESEIFKDEGTQKKPVKTSPPKPRIEVEQQILRSSQISPQRKSIKIPQIPKLSQKNQTIPLIPSIAMIPPMQQSRIMKTQYSILSNQISIQHYQQFGGLRPQNSMANLRNSNINDVSDNFIKKQSVPTIPMIYQSRIIQSIPSIVKANIFEGQKRIPTFLRDIRKHISIYPNFYAYNNINTSECIRDQFNSLFDLFTEAIQILCSQYEIKEETVYVITVEFFYFLVLSKVVYNLMPLSLLNHSKQESGVTKKAKAALNNYQIIVKYYKDKGINVNIDTDKGKKKYFQIRQKFWDICGNMKLISEDIYTEMIDCEYPQHFYIFLKFLKESPNVRINNQTTTHIKQLTHLYRTLRSENDLLLNSQIGIKVKQKLDYQTKYMFPY